MHREVTHNKFPASFGHLVEAIFDFFRRRMPQEWTKWRERLISVASVPQDVDDTGTATH